MDKTLHLGKMIQDYIDSKNHKRTTVANSLGVPNTAIYGYEKRASVHTSTLLRICHVLKYNFFMDIANSLPREYGHGQLVASEMKELLDRQAKEIEKLKLENELMKELMMGRKN